MTTTLSRVSSLTVAALACTPAEDEAPPSVPDQTRQDPILYAQPTSLPSTLSQPDDDSTSPTDEQPTADQPSQQFTEDQRWCQAWALDNLEPLVYVSFLELDPLNMDDIDRTIWRARLRNGSCSMYGSEPLNAGNADRRNEQFKVECLDNLARLADYQWETLAEAAYQYDNPTAHEIPNQYVRMMHWMHLSGEELLNMEEPPRELLDRISGYSYTSEGNRYINIPTADDIEKARADHGDDFSIDWWGLHYAATKGYPSSLDGCSEYFPQFFHGRWIPHSEPHNQTPTPSPEQQRVLDQFNSDIQSVLDSSLYLPKP